MSLNMNFTQNILTFINYFTGMINKFKNVTSIPYENHDYFSGGNKR